MRRYGGDASVCVRREGRGWESLGIDVHLIDTAEGLMGSHLKTHLYSSLERVFETLNTHINVCVHLLKCVCVSPVEGAGGLLHGGKGLYLSVSNVTVFF